VSGGTKSRKSAPKEDFAADWHIVSAASKVLVHRKVAADAEDILQDRIETVLSEEESSESFRLGTIRHPRGKTSEARRFSFVRGIDALIAVAGGGGTAQELALAHELEKPVMPVPFFGGTAEVFWKAYATDLIRMMRLTEARTARWQAQAQGTTRQLTAVAGDMVDALLKSLPRRCFVIMPFGEDFAALYDFVICRALEEAGDLPIRLDRTEIPGDAIKQIDEALGSCEYAIVVLDGMRPNVLYELGLAHGRAKPTILMNRKGHLSREAPVPFDITTRQRIEYQSLDATLTTRVKKAIDSLAIRRY
jgi:hypothetical protein